MNTKVLLTAMFPLCTLMAATWQGASGPPFNWNNTANWSPAAVPNAIGAQTNFPDAAPNKTVTLNINATVGQVTFVSTTLYQIIGSQTLTLHDFVSNALIENAFTGPASVATPISLANNLSLSTLSTGSLTVSGVISGSGSVTVTDVGGGGVTLSAQNQYQGGTTLQTGTLQLAATNALPIGRAVHIVAGTLDLGPFSQMVGTLSAVSGSITLGGAQLAVAPTSAAAFAAVISGPGIAVEMLGPATWSINAVQTYSAPTIITGGTMEMGVANALPGTTAVTVNSPGILDLNSNNLAVRSLAGSGTVDVGGGTLTLNTTGLTTFSGVIQGAGALSVQGTGIQVLSGTSTYSAGTTVGVNATLQGTTMSLQGAIVNSGALIFNQSFSGQYAGPLSGAGQLQLDGGGTLTLTGSPSQGSVEVVAGTLNVPSGANVTATTLTVDSSGQLTGSGQVTASILNSGIIMPGSPQLTVSGNVTFQSGSSLVTTITPTTANLLNVLGSTTINAGANEVIRVSSGIYAAEASYTLLASTGGVTGQFQSLTISNPLLNGQLIYNADSVELELSIVPIANIIKGGKAGAIAKCLSPTNLEQDLFLTQVVFALAGFPTVEEIREVLDEMQPSQLRALTVAEQTNAFLAMELLTLRTSQWSRSTCERELNPAHPWNFWVSAAGNWTDQKNIEHNVGYTAPAAGVATGFDGRVARNLYFGLMAEYGYTALSWREGQGSATINRASAGPYIGWFGRAAYINGVLLGSFAHFHANRKIPFFDLKATSSHNGGSFLSHMDGGFLLHPSQRTTLTPFAALDLLIGWENKFKERGAQSLSFAIDSSSSALFRSEVGMKASRCTPHSYGKWVQEIKASWIHEERLHGRDLTAKFQTFPCSFTVSGVYPSRSFLGLAMGVTFISATDLLATTLKYDGQFGKRVTIQSAIAQLLVRF